MRYTIRVAGKLFAGDNPKVLLKRAVEAKRRALKKGVRPHELMMQVGESSLVSRPAIQPA